MAESGIHGAPGWTRASFGQYKVVEYTVPGEVQPVLVLETMDRAEAVQTALAAIGPGSRCVFNDLGRVVLGYNPLGAVPAEAGR